MASLIDSPRFGTVNSSAIPAPARQCLFDDLPLFQNMRFVETGGWARALNPTNVAQRRRFPMQRDHLAKFGEGETPSPHIARLLLNPIDLGHFGKSRQQLAELLR